MQYAPLLCCKYAQGALTCCGMRLVWPTLHQLYSTKPRPRALAVRHSPNFQFLPAACQRWRGCPCASGARPDCALRLALAANPIGINLTIRYRGTLAASEGVAKMQRSRRTETQSKSSARARLPYRRCSSRSPQPSQWQQESGAPVLHPAPCGPGGRDPPWSA